MNSQYREIDHWYGTSDREPDRAFKLVEIDEENGYLKWQMLFGGWILTTTYDGLYVKGLNLVSETNITTEFGDEEYAVNFLSDDDFTNFIERSRIENRLNEIESEREYLITILSDINKKLEF